MAITYDLLTSSYPIQTRVNLMRNVLGAGFTDLIDNPNYQNTCALRLSVALNRSGNRIPAQYGAEDGNHKDKLGHHIIIRVRTLSKFLEEILGNSNWGISKQPGSPFEFSNVPFSKGIIMYHAEFSDATGHADLWSGDSCLFGCPVPDINTAFAVELWKLQ